MDVNAYLRRIDHHGPLAPEAETLRALHRAHLLAAPFENLDIHLGRPIVLDEDRLFDKIVRRQRGGFCYELNGLFAALLRELGFQATLLSARVATGNGSFGPEFDHLTLLVNLDERWLADVGFGDSFIEPLRLDEPSEQRQASGVYQIVHRGAEWGMQAKNRAGAMVDSYLFTLQPRQLAEFTGMCHYHQTSPASHFTQKRVCSRAAPEGRVTLSGDKLILTVNGRREEKCLTPPEYAAALKEHFGIVL